MQYGNYEVVVYGGGEVYRDIFNAVALLSGTGPIDSLFRLTLLLGLLLGIMKAMADFNFAALMRWFIMAAMIYGIIWVPKVRIHITDKFNSGLAGADIANMPLGIAFAAATSSEIGDTIIKSTETAFADPQGLSYSESGLIYGAKLYDQMRTWHVSNPLFAANLQSFMVNCTYNDILTNHLSVGDVESSPALWSIIVNAANPALYFPYSNANDTPPTQISCQQGANQLDGQWAQEIQYDMVVQQRRLQPGQPAGAAGTLMQNTLEALTTATGLASQSATNTMQQVLVINTMKQAMTAYGATAGSAVGPLAQTQAQLQTQDVQQMIGETAQKALVTLQIVITVLFIGVFPIMAPMFLLPVMGIGMMKGYFSGFIYLQLWGPMYVILNKVMMWHVYTQTLASTYMPNATGAQPSITFQNLASLGSVNADLAGVAGCMAAAIPMIAGMLTKGAIAGAEAAASGVMHTYQRSAEAAGASAASGNYTYGATAVDTHQFHNTDGNRFHTSSDADTGRSSYRDPQGNLRTANPDGSTTVQAAMSSVPFSAKVGETMSATASQNASRFREESKAVETTFGSARNWVDSKINEHSSGVSSGSSRTTTTGDDDRSGMREVYDTRAQAIDSVSKRLGISHSQATSHVNSASEELYGDAHAGGGFGLPKILPAWMQGSATVGVRGSGSHKDELSVASQTQRGIDLAKQELVSSGYTKARDHATQVVATDMWSKNYGTSEGYRDVNSSTFSSSKSVSDSQRALDSQGERWSQTSEWAKRTDFSQDKNLSNIIVNGLHKRYEDGNPVRDVHGEAIPFGKLINPTGPDAREISGYRDEAIAPYLKDFAAQVAVDPSAMAGMSSGLGRPSTLEGSGSPSMGSTPPHVGGRSRSMFSHAVEDRFAGAPSRSDVAQAPIGDSEHWTRDAGKAGARAATETDGQPDIRGRLKTLENAHERTGAARIGAPLNEPGAAAQAAGIL